MDFNPLCICGHKKIHHHLGDYGRVWLCIACHNELGNEHRFKLDNLAYVKQVQEERELLHGSSF